MRHIDEEFAALSMFGGLTASGTHAARHHRVGTTLHLNMVELGRHGRNRTNVRDYASVNSMRGSRREDLALHPTVKPTGLVADAIPDLTRHGDLVLDLFLGSGTTLMAAERTGRRSRSAPNPGWFPKGRSGNLKGRPTSSRAPKALRVRGVGGKTLTVTDHLGTREITM